MAYEVKQTGRNKFDKVFDDGDMTIYKIPSDLTQEARSAYYANSVLINSEDCDDATIVIAPNPSDYLADFVGCVVFNVDFTDIDLVLDKVSDELNVDITNVKAFTYGDYVRATFDAHTKVEAPVDDVVVEVDDATKQAMSLMAQVIQLLNK